MCCLRVGATGGGRGVPLERDQGRDEMSETLSALIAAHDGSAPALGAPGRDWMDYAGLRGLSGQVAAALHRAGIGRGDRVAIVLPNGPEMAAAFVTVAQVATTCPLNPAYKEDEFAFYLDDLRAKAIILMEGEDGPALAAARAQDMTVIRLIPGTGAAGGGKGRAVFPLHEDDRL